MKLEAALQTTRFRDETHKASLNILYTAWWLKTVISKELKRVDLTHEQYNVMRILKGKSPERMCVKDIAGRMIEKNSNVPRIIDRLVEKKLVRRQAGAEDKRQTEMQLTALGIKRLERASEQIDLLATRLLDLSEPDARRLNQLLETFRSKE